ESNANTYADGLASNYDAAGAAVTAESNANTYADGLASNYDAAGAAVTAESNANTYADGLVVNVVNHDNSGNVTITGTLKAGAVTYPNSSPSADGQVLAAYTDGSTAWVDPAIVPSRPKGDQGEGKTFVINHPTKSDSYLVHACLEGPEAGVYYRGEAKIEDNKSVTIQLPDYVSSFASNFTIQITPIYSDDSDENIVYSTSRVKNNSFSVRGKNGSFYWIVYGQRGTIVVEPKKAEVQVFGDGPYKYIKHDKH
ncbi:MAG: hypothetical protein WCJ26_11540, partial [bacterium]